MASYDPARDSKYRTDTDDSSTLRPGAASIVSPSPDRSDTRNGPLPTDDSKSAVSAGTTPNAGEPTTDGNADHGRSSSTRTTPSSGVVTATTGASRSATVEPESGRARRSSVA